ncbi:hypothetical protein L2E82_12272 [Cichorium intybus]|uniref:Uncharacterized protein n=1 Tax=Cichorium intybus TaxID=13427 RepID=A0ACB9GFC6_CICIN|nr:hypothetical protein L2E82_12272 [Cichorium intybus]
MFTGELPARIGSCADFQFIDVLENFLTGSIPPDMHLGGGNWLCICMFLLFLLQHGPMAWWNSYKFQIFVLRKALEIFRYRVFVPLPYVGLSV